MIKVQFQLLNDRCPIRYLDHVNYRMNEDIALRYSFICHVDSLKTLNPTLQRDIKDVKSDRLHVIPFRDKNSLSLKHLPFNVILSKRPEIP